MNGFAYFRAVSLMQSQVSNAVAQLIVFKLVHSGMFEILNNPF